MQAAEKAIYESMQSWTATNWIDSHQNTESKVYWDTRELMSRIADLSSLTVDESHGISHVTSELARIAMRDDEHISVFTPHNL